MSARERAGECTPSARTFARREARRRARRARARSRAGKHAGERAVRTRVGPAGPAFSGPRAFEVSRCSVSHGAASPSRRECGASPSLPAATGRCTEASES